MSYRDFVARKFQAHQPSGFDAVVDASNLKPHQHDITRWALRRGRSAIFADTGLGKSRMQITWAKHVVERTLNPVLILAPLAVAAQTVMEGQNIGIKITHCKSASDVTDGINITNYDRLHLFDCSAFAGVVLDESSIIKHHTSKTLGLLMDAFLHTQYKLCATATPAPNDWTELGTHAEFLGVCSQSEMLAEFFCHDGGETQKWRLKGHARQAFWRWVASWGCLLRSPADLGYDATDYILPPLQLHQHTIESTQEAFGGYLFALEASSLSERREAKKSTMDGRVAECAALVNADNEPWLIWCEFNAEGELLRKAIPGAVEISGSDDRDVKEQRLMDFVDGKIRVLITKPKIAGFGLNFQHCNRMAFVGVTDSFEAYYQAVRRCWRFGQKRPVDVHLFVGSLEGAIASNLRRKEQDAKMMADELAKETIGAVREGLIGMARETNEYAANTKLALPSFLKGM